MKQKSEVEEKKYFYKRPTGRVHKRVTRPACRPKGKEVGSVKGSIAKEIDGTVALLNLDSKAKPIGEEVCKALVQCANSQANGRMMLLDGPKEPADQLRAECDQNSGFDMSENIRCSESVLDFKYVKNFEAFNIIVDGSVINSELPEDIRKKYYKLCCSEKCFLHRRLPASLNLNLIAGIILQIVNVADAIRASNFTTPCNDLERWNKTLKSFEDLGMTVGFLSDRLKKLLNISYEQKKIEMKKLERKELEEKIGRLTLELKDAKGALRNVDCELADLEVEGHKLEHTYTEVVSAPW